MSVKVKIPSDAILYWMKKCVHCGCESDRRDTVFKARYRGTGYYLVFFTYNQKLFQISYPVCLKCKIFAKLYRFVYWTLLIPIIVLGLSLILGLLSGDAFNINIAIAFFIVLIIFVLSIFLQPLRIVEANDNEIVLKFRNEQIANEFLSHNKLPT